MKLISEEIAAYEARECRLLLEISNLHRAIGGVRVHAERALKDCMHPSSIQAVRLRHILEIVDGTIPNEKETSND